MKRERLREGFTTGSAAAAGAKAAVLLLLGQPYVRDVDIALPIDGRIKISVESVEILPGEVARATVIKDGGDDPDVTHKAQIRVNVKWIEDVKAGIIIEGGKGVGRVTRLGLPVAIGKAAINPAPLLQIEAAVKEGLQQCGIKKSVSVIIEVDNGEQIAKKTLNPRLGIVGGISILGTRGTVKPFSNDAYKDTITISMDVAKASNANIISLSTGGKSERYLRRIKNKLPDSSFIQVADFFAFSIKAAAERGFKEIIYSCFFGKLVKMAQGFSNTHAKHCRMNLEKLSKWCIDAGMNKISALDVANANTSIEALHIINRDSLKNEILGVVVNKAMASARKFAGPNIDITYYLFDFDGSIVMQKQSKGNF
ncbi:MAG: cobalt-precorrin-5B (C(1))-methyltransferase [Desulfobacterales bacterium]